MRINIFKLKKGKEDILRDWGKEISKDINEATASLVEEGCIEESLRIFEIGDEKYVVGVMCGEKGKKILPHNPDREINKKHFKILKECFGVEVSQEKIYSVKVE